MKRLLFPTLLTGLAVLLTACPQPVPQKPPPPLTLAWQSVLLTPDQELILDAAATDRYVYVFNEELPLSGDYTQKWAALWRVEATTGEVLGPVKFPDDAAAQTLAAEGFGCPQPMGPDVEVDGGGRVYVSVALRNAAAQAVGCDTFDGSWVNSAWAAFGIFDGGLQRTGLAWKKVFGSDDPTHSGLFAHLAGAGSSAQVAGGYAPDSRVYSWTALRGPLSADGTLNLALEGGAGEMIWRAYTLPEGWLAKYVPDDPVAAGYGERLVRYDDAGNVAWEAVTGTSPFPTERAAGVPGNPEVVFVSGVARGGEPYLGQAPPASEPDTAVFVARIDGGRLSWIRWIHAEESGWFSTNRYAVVPIVYDPAKDELYAADNEVIIALDPASGETRWITNLREIITGDPWGVDDWFFVYQPQNFTHLFLVEGRLVGVSYSWWDSNQGRGSETDRYRPLVLGLDRRY
ncbi:hypothetical protein [Oceanithermus sp.]|uniref:hypothetical protein n=1 Tax=Oceanithermus sp. TaxID=2268145 RepID=UPI00257D66D9|nr:hypothetical protein [Oceanithermus sp.]